MDPAYEKVDKLGLIITNPETKQYEVLGRIDEVSMSVFGMDGRTDAPIDLNLLSVRIADANEKKGFGAGADIIPEKLMLIVSELAEALEEHRAGRLALEVYFEEKPDGSKKPAGFAIELADALIRILHLSAALNIDIGYATALKCRYNETRPHMHGKSY